MATVQKRDQLRMRSRAVDRKTAGMTTAMGKSSKQVLSQMERQSRLAPERPVQSPPTSASSPKAELY